MWRNHTLKKYVFWSCLTTKNMYRLDFVLGHSSIPSSQVYTYVFLQVNKHYANNNNNNNNTFSLFSCGDTTWLGQLSHPNQWLRNDNYFQFLWNGFWPWQSPAVFFVIQYPAYTYLKAWENKSPLLSLVVKEFIPFWKNDETNTTTLNRLLQT